MSRRRVAIWYDIDGDTLRGSPGGESLRQYKYPTITFREELIVNLTLVTDSSLTVYTGLPASGMVYEAALDYAFDSASLMCKTLDAGINMVGDWGASGNADPTQGQVSIRLSANTTGFQTKIGTKAEILSTKLELQGKESNDLVNIFRMPFGALGLISDSGDLPPQITDNTEWFVDTAGKQCLRFINDYGEVMSTMVPPGGTGVPA